MGQLLRLLWPKWLALGRPSQESSHSAVTVIFFGLLGLLFWWGIYKGASWLCIKCLAIEDIGSLLLQKILSMALLTFFSILVFSNLVTAFSTYFLADDLSLLNSAPVPKHTLFAARFTETLLHASWMIVVFGAPFLLAYGQTYRADATYYAMVLAVAVPFVLIPCAFSVLLSTILAAAFPAKRTRELLLFLSVLGFVGLILYVRALQPERFLDPDRFKEAIAFLGMLRDPTAVYLPSDWAVLSLFPFLTPKSSSFMPVYLAALYSTAAALMVLAYWTYEWLNATAYSRSQEGKQKQRKAGHVGLGERLAEGLLQVVSWPFSLTSRVMLAKEMRTFWRNPGQWSQLMLLGALVVVYILNFSSMRKMSALKVYGVPAIIAEMGIYLFNLVLLGFVVSAVAVRFAFPAVSLEGRCFWLIRHAPVSMRAFLRAKFWSVFLPLLVLAESMVVMTNLFIKATWLQGLFAAFTVLLMTIGVTGMGVGLGAIYPRFHIDNPAKISTGFGGVLYMICAMIWVAVLIGLELLPLRHFLMARLTGQGLTSSQVWQSLSMFGLTLLITALAYIIPMRLGARSLEKIGR